MTNLIDADFFAASTGSTPRHSRGETSNDGQIVEFAKHLTSSETGIPEDALLQKGQSESLEAPILAAGIPTAALEETPAENTDVELVIRLKASPASDGNTPEIADISAPTIKRDTAISTPDGKPVSDTTPTPDAHQSLPEKPSSTAVATDTPVIEEMAPGKINAVETTQLSPDETATKVPSRQMTPDTDSITPGELTPKASGPDAKQSPPSGLAEVTPHNVEQQVRTATASSASATFAEAPSTPTLQAAPTQTTLATPVASVTPAAAAPPPTLTAPPAEIPAILSQSLSGIDEQKDRIVVQLDPPELGRVSIDFKFDAAGLQNITITGETPEALRQLRQMHFELLQALERQGLSSQNMTFQQSGSNADTDAQLFSSDGDGETGNTMPRDNEVSTRRPAPLPSVANGTGLDIRV